MDSIKNRLGGQAGYSIAQLFIIKDTEAKNEGTLLFKRQDTERVSWKDESNDVIQGQPHRLPNRYRELRTKEARGRFLTRLSEAFGFERKYLIKLLNGQRGFKPPRGRGRTYEKEVERMALRLRRLAGVRRYAAAQKLEVVAVQERRAKARAIATLISRRRPVGCVVECHTGGTDLEPSLFSDVPVVYLNPSPELFGGRRMASVAQDDAAIVGVAMRELTGNHPTAYAYVGYDWPTSWDAARQKTFRKLANASGLPACIFESHLPPSGNVAARAALRRWLAALPRRCGIVAPNDRIAAETVEAARCSSSAANRRAVLGDANPTSSKRFRLGRRPARAFPRSHGDVNARIPRQDPTFPTLAPQKSIIVR